MDLQGAPYGYTVSSSEHHLGIASVLLSGLCHYLMSRFFSVRSPCAPPENQRWGTSFGDLAFGRIISAIDRITFLHSM